MATPTPYAKAEGALYELMSRGNKDVYFNQDIYSSKYAFDNTYAPQAPSSFEIRRIPPSSACEFGRTLQFEFDLVGDVMRNPTLLINLPSWLPPTQASSNTKSIITDTTGVSYGYTNGIAYFLFDLIQFYQDNILLQEFSGDALWATTKNQGSYGYSFVVNELTGQDEGSHLSIGRRASPPQLRLQLPLVGNQSQDDPGFPERSTKQHTYRLRMKLRKLEDLVEASDGRIKPHPWGQTFQQSLTRGGTPVPFNTLPREQIPPPELFLETTEVYLPREYQDELETKAQEITFIRHFENIYNINALDYAGVMGGSTSVIKRRIDARHPSGRIVFFFRSMKAVYANQLWNTSSGIQSNGNSFFNTITLQIAGKDREMARNPFVWRDITNFAKETIDTGDELYTMNWTLGAIAPKRFPGSESQPTGSVNFSTADRATAYIDLTTAPLDPYTGSANTELRIIVEGWARFDTDGKGRAQLYSGN